MNHASAAETALFGDALACQLDLPATYSEHAPEAGTIERAIARAESTLHAIALIEDTRLDEPDDQNGTEVALQRVEAKLNLLLELVAKLARQGIPPLPLRRLRWSRRGVALQQPIAASTRSGFLLLQPIDALPQQLELPVERLEMEPSGDDQQILYLQFKPLPLNLESAIERHLFRLHRRQIAIARMSG